MQVNIDPLQQQTITVTLTKNGMIPLPIAVQKVLHVTPGKRVIFHIHNKDVVVTAEPYTLETLVGSLIPKRPIKDIEKTIEEAKEEHAQQMIEKMFRYGI